MEFTANQKKKFEKDIEFMQNLINVYTWESCNLIRAHLAISGKLRASELSERVGLQGDKSVYKSLNRLIEAGLVAKKFDEGSKRNAYYYTTEARILDPEFSKEFIAYLLDEDKYYLISDYLKAANQASMGFLQVMTDIMEQQILLRNDPLIGEKFISKTTFIEAIMSLPDPEPLLDKISQLVKEEVSPHMIDKIDPGQPVPHASALYLAFVPLSFSGYDK